MKENSIEINLKKPIKGAVFSFLIMFFAFVGVIAAQSSQVAYDFQVQVKGKVLEAQQEIQWFNPGSTKLDSIPVYLYINALHHKNSFYYRELLEDQVKDLHFANASKLPQYQHIQFKQGNQLLTFNQDADTPEIVWVKLAKGIEAGDSLNIEAAFTLQMGELKFIPPIAVNNRHIMQFWYPQLVHYEYDAWRICPMNSAYNLCEAPAVFRAKILVEPQYTAFGVGEWDQVERSEVGNKYSVIVQGHKHFSWMFAPDVLPFKSEKNQFYNFPERLSLLSTAPSLLDELSKYLQKRWAISLAQNSIVVDVADFKKAFYPGGGIVGLTKVQIKDYLIPTYVGAYVTTAIKSSHSSNFFEKPWLGDGLAAFLKYEFLQDQYPDVKLLGPLANYFFSKYFEFESFPYEYQTTLLYLFMARQGLDQAPNSHYEDIPRFNYLGMVEGKTSKTLSHLKSYMGDKKFVQAWWNLMDSESRVSLNDSIFRKAFEDQSGKNLSWAFEDLLSGRQLHDYKALSSERCSYLQVVEVKNKGNIQAPLSISGEKDGKIVYNQWFEGFEGTKTLPIRLDTFDRIRIDGHYRTAEVNYHNNSLRTKGIFKRMEPIRLQFYNGLENPAKNQIYWFPHADYNAYDQLLLGVNIYNRGLLLKQHEYNIAPTLSTGTGKLTGSASYTWNKPYSKGPVQMMKLGIFGRYFHYDEDLAFTRISPAANIWWRKKHPRSEHIHRSRARLLWVDRELAPDVENNQLDFSSASYSLFNAGHFWEYVSILRPIMADVQLEVSQNFGKLYGQWDQRWMLPNKKWMIARVFAGAFLYNDQPLGNNFYNFGLGGTLDYQFDYIFYGRSDSSGIWSQQMFITDGAFRAPTQVFASQWMSSLNLSIPIYKIFGVYADVAMADNINTLYWGYGIRLAFLTDFAELYLPIQTYNQGFGMSGAPYLPQIRFLINLKPADIEARLRRGWF